MARSETRPVVTLRSTAGTGRSYVTRKNRRNNPDRLVLRKYDPVSRPACSVPRGTLTVHRPLPYGPCRPSVLVPGKECP